MRERERKHKTSVGVFHAWLSRPGRTTFARYVKGVVSSFKRSGTATQYENQNILRIQGVNAREETGYYLGKKVAYVYKAQTEKKVFAAAAARPRKIADL